MPPRIPIGPAITSTPMANARVPKMAFCSPGFCTSWVVLVSRLSLSAGAALISTPTTTATAGATMTARASPHRTQNRPPRRWRRRGCLDTAADRKSVAADPADDQPSGEVGEQTDDQQEEAQLGDAAHRHAGEVAERRVELVGDARGERRGGPVQGGWWVVGHPDDQ